MVHQFSKSEKDQIVIEVRETFAARFSTPSYKSCLAYSILMCRAIIKRGSRAILQAGTCMWPRIKPEQDDGIMATHFSYVWEPDSSPSVESMLAGNLPEMHVWVAIPEVSEIVDINTASIPRHALEFGYDWPGDIPPDYFWGSKLPNGVIYSPNIQAIKLALTLAELLPIE